MDEFGIRKYKLFKDISVKIKEADFSQYQVPLPDVFKFLLEKYGERGEAYVDQIFELVKKGECQTLEEIVECVDIRIRENKAIGKIPSLGKMRDIYLAVYREGSPYEEMRVIKILKSAEEVDEPLLKEKIRALEETGRREWEALQKLNHDNIVRVWEPGKYQGRHYIIEEYVEGCSLREWLEKNPSGLERGKNFERIFSKIIEGLKYLHGKTYIHRDIKPGNILVSEDLTKIKIDDLQTAIKAGESGQHLSNLYTRDLRGESYAAPELVKEGKASFASDVYAFGLSMYAFLVGDLKGLKLDETRGDQEKYQKNLEGAIKCVPKKYRKVVGRCLPYSPEKRISVDQLAWKFRRMGESSLTRIKRRAGFLASSLLLGVALVGTFLHYTGESRERSRIISEKEAEISSLEAELLKSCNEHYFDGNLLRAKECFDKIGEWGDYEKRKSAYQKLLQILVDKAQYSAVQGLFSKVKAEELEKPEVFYHELGQAFLYQRDYRQALDYFKKAEDFRKNNPWEIVWTWHEMGNVYFRKGDYFEAERYYDYAAQEYGAKLDPEMKEFLGWHYQKSGYLSLLREEPKKAREHLERSARIFSLDRPDQLGLAWTLHHQLLLCIYEGRNCEKQGKEALSLFEKVESKEGIIWTNYQMARAILTKAAAFKKEITARSVPGVHFYLGRFEKLDKAREYLVVSLTLEKELKELKMPEGLANIYSLLGELEWYAGHSQEAVDYLRQSLDFINNSNYRQKANFKDATMVISRDLDLLREIGGHDLDLAPYQNELEKIKREIGTKKFELFLEELNTFGLLS